MRQPVLALPALAALLAGCGGPAPTPSAAGAPAKPAAAGSHAGHDHAGHDHAGHDHAGGIALPEAVQRNLGITWATVEYRVVQGVVRMPGRFEAEPSARRAYRTPLAGRIDLLVRPYQRVAAGDPLYRLHAEEWQRLQLAIAEGCGDGCAGGCGTVGAAGRALAAGRQRAEAVEEALRAWTARAGVLADLGREVGGTAAEQAEAATRIAELRLQAAEAQRELLRLEREAAGPDGTPATGLAALRLRQMLDRAAAITGLTREELEARDGDGVPRWLAIAAPVVRAAGPGVVEGETASDGAWVESGAAVLTVTDPAVVRLRAAALQADLPRLADGMRARIAPAAPGPGGSVPATLAIAPVADAVDRSVDLAARPDPGAALPAWVRPGVAAVLEVPLDGSAGEELAIPAAATIRDGLRTVIYRQDPRDPGRVVEVEADLGASDGRFVAVQSGLKEGDRVVLGGIYPLMLSRRAGGAQGGHFDADGTFHTGSH